MTDVLKPRTRGLPVAHSVRFNPGPGELRDLIAAMPNARRTAFDSFNVQTRVVSRSKTSTYVATDAPAQHSCQTISRAELAVVATRQDAHIATRDMLVIDGYIGNDPVHRVAARLYVEAANANIAAMQQALYFEATDGGEEFQPALTVIDTPGLAAPGYPDERLIAVDLDSGVTRVLNSDYFGESKKGGLRMWNALTHARGGLSLHAGCKVVPTGNRGEQVMLIVGLSGTGKTTTTFTRQNGSQPVQDDFVALYPGGHVVATENGCFAKTFALDPADEPSIHGAVTRREAYLENVSQDDSGRVDFFDTSYTQNGRAVFRMDALGIARDAGQVGRVTQLLILNRNENLIPVVARLDRRQAAAYFMLGETQGTSAGGREEAGKFLRVPGTNPFFPLLDDQQGNRFLELMDDARFEVFLLNTGRIGGPEADERSRKVSIPVSSAVVKAIAEGSIAWERDPEFGYSVAASLPGVDDAELLQPRRLYQRQGRLDEYARLVERLKRERAEYLAGYPRLQPEIAAAVR